MWMIKDCFVTKIRIYEWDNQTKEAHYNKEKLWKRKKNYSIVKNICIFKISNRKPEYKKRKTETKN